jgi:hypothetical protein
MRGREKNGGGERMQDVGGLVLKELGNLVEAVERLREEVQLLREVVLGRKMRKGGKVVGGWRLRVSELSGEELEFVKRFLYWVWEFKGEWVDVYLRNEAEGFDPVRMRIYLRGRTFERLLERVCSEGYSKREVMRLLSDLGLLMYRVDERGLRQYCISVRLRVGVGANGRERKGVASRYVIDWGRVEELTQEVLELEKRRKEGSGAEEGEERASELKLEREEV